MPAKGAPRSARQTASSFFAGKPRSYRGLPRQLLHLSAIALPRMPSWEFLKNQYAAPHICASTLLQAQIAPTRQMTFSPSPTAGRKIRVYVLKAGAVYQKNKPSQSPRSRPQAGFLMPERYALTCSPLQMGRVQTAILRDSVAPGRGATPVDGWPVSRTDVIFGSLYEPNSIFLIGSSQFYYPDDSTH